MEQLLLDNGGMECDQVHWFRIGLHQGLSGCIIWDISTKI